jgi:hypothetical protein
MHYGNGRPAQNGDKVIMVSSDGKVLTGLLYDAIPGIDACNGRLAQISNSDAYLDLRQVYHIDDAKAVLATIPAYVDPNAAPEPAPVVEDGGSAGDVTAQADAPDPTAVTDPAPVDGLPLDNTSGIGAVSATPSADAGNGTGVSPSTVG